MKKQIIALSLLASLSACEIDNSGAKKVAANLKDANLENTQLEYANFSFADLRGANLKNANLKNAIFYNAKLDGAIWSNGLRCKEGSVGNCHFT